MDAKRYSLNEIFGFLREATLILDRPVTVISEDTEGNEVRTPMIMSEFIAMSVAKELTSTNSRMASEETTASKADVIAAMTANYYDEVAYPNYEGVGISYGHAAGRMRSSRSRRKTRRIRR
uniref:Uncharacterized protein n=1 Tax=viral metagenome TaxID=1070528 RepID=A0A6C0DRG2_9ZZZZ